MYKVLPLLVLLLCGCCPSRSSVRYHIPLEKQDIAAQKMIELTRIYLENNPNHWSPQELGARAREEVERIYGEPVYESGIRK